MMESFLYLGLWASSHKDSYFPWSWFSRKHVALVSSMRTLVQTEYKASHCNGFCEVSKLLWLNWFNWIFPITWKVLPSAIIVHQHSSSDWNIYTKWLTSLMMKIAFFKRNLVDFAIWHRLICLSMVHCVAYGMTQCWKFQLTDNFLKKKKKVMIRILLADSIEDTTIWSQIIGQQHPHLQRRLASQLSSRQRTWIDSSYWQRSCRHQYTLCCPSWPLQAQACQRCTKPCCTQRLLRPTLSKSF